MQSPMFCQALEEPHSFLSGVSAHLRVDSTKRVRISQHKQCLAFANLFSAEHSVICAAHWLLSLSVRGCVGLQLLIVQVGH